MTPPNRYQWLVFSAVVVVGIFVSLALQHLFMAVLLKPEKVARDAAKRVGKPADSLDYKKLGHLGTGLQRWVGTMEIILYSTSIVFKHPEFIAVWLGTKYVAAYRTWGKEPVGRTFYNRSLFGSGLNVLLGAATGGLAVWAMYYDKWRSFKEVSRIPKIPTKGAAMLQLIIGTIIGALFSIAITIVVENARRPKLGLAIEEPPHEVPYKNHKHPAKIMRTLRVRLYNKSLPAGMRWMLRAPALQCRATITFHRDERDVFGRVMHGRWSSSVTPLPVPVTNTEGDVQFWVNDPDRLVSDSRIDVYPGDDEFLDIAVRFDDEEDCYGWCNESYAHPAWRDPNWKLQSGQYVVKVTVASSGQKCVRKFRLTNDGARADFRLEPMS